MKSFRHPAGRGGNIGSNETQAESAIKDYSTTWPYIGNSPMERGVPRLRHNPSKNTHCPASIEHETAPAGIQTTCRTPRIREPLLGPAHPGGKEERLLLSKPTHTGR